MALSADIEINRYGTTDGHQPLNKGLVSGQTVYRGSVAVSGVGVGYLKNPTTTPATTDLVWGIVANAGPGIADTGPGIVGTSPSGTVSVDIQTGTFILASGTGADALDVTTNGTSVYLINESTVGKTSGSSTRPVAGTQLACNADDASIPVGFVAVKIGTFGGP